MNKVYSAVIALAAATTLVGAGCLNDGARGGAGGAAGSHYGVGGGVGTGGTTGSGGGSAPDAADDRAMIGSTGGESTTGVGGTPGTGGDPGQSPGSGGTVAGTGGAAVGVGGAPVGTGGQGTGGSNAAGTGGSCDTGYFPQNNTCHVAATAVGVGETHACVLLADGTVWCWGSNSAGQVGNGAIGNTPDVLVPDKVVGIEDAVVLSVGLTHSCVILRDGSIRCWGTNSAGELGNGPQTADSPTPVTVTGIQGATSVACGTGFTCALLAGGSVQCWGANDFGQLGNGMAASVLPVSRVPVAVSGVATATLVAAGGANGCVALSGAAVQCWGKSDDGQLGVTTTYSSLPLTVAGISGPTALTIGQYHVCGLLTGGGVTCWGLNLDGQLGNGVVLTSGKPLDVRGITGATSIGAGELDTCATMGDGSARCWGFGALGNGATDLSESYTPVVVTGLTGATRMAMSNANGCALRSNGSVVCWGVNLNGGVGNGTKTTYAPTPVAVTATW